jgi:hypothetical protein
VTLQSRQKALLALLGLLLAVAVWRWLPSGDDGGVFGGPRARAGAGPATEVSELRLADLEPTPGVHPAGRDPFRYGAPPAPPGPTPEEIEAARLQAQAEAEARARALAAQQAAVPPPPPEPQPPEVPFRYLGSFGSAARRVAVFSDGKSIYNALQGDVLEGQFIVHRIGLESVDLRFVAFPKAPPKRLAAGG